MARACCTVEELAAFSQRELAKFKAPKMIKLVESLRKGTSGKIQRLNLLKILPSAVTRREHRHEPGV